MCSVFIAILSYRLKNTSLFIMMKRESRSSIFYRAGKSRKNGLNPTQVLDIKNEIGKKPTDLFKLICSVFIAILSYRQKILPYLL